jgi:N-formylglutamate amidohydrolase
VGLFLAPAALAQPYETGQVYFGRNDYVEYYAGDLPLIFSAPHGGELTPNEISDRTSGTTVTDSFTRETVLAIRESVFEYTGRYPHVVLSNLKRTKLDPNREIVEAAEGNQWAEQAWTEYHGFIDSAKESITTEYGKGFYVDIHGHGHTLQRLELGYLITSSDLGRSDTELDTSGLAGLSSIGALVTDSNTSFSEFIRGLSSLGSLFEAQGISAVPSSSQPSPGSGNPYFTGGYSTVRHGSRNGGFISSVQIEAYRVGLRDTAVNRKTYADAITAVFDEYLRLHFGWAGIVTGIEVGVGTLPEELRVPQNHPNPFFQSTIIEYVNPEASRVTVRVYNMLGQELETILDRYEPAGVGRISWNARQRPSGIYFYEVEAGGRSIANKMILLR